MAFTLLLALEPAAAQTAVSIPVHALDERYASAVALFRQARFPAAYGRLVELADLGHERAARHALWMCEHGQELFGRPFDCAPHQIEEWALRTGVSGPAVLARIYPRLTPSTLAAQGPAGRR